MTEEQKARLLKVRKEYLKRAKEASDFADEMRLEENWTNVWIYANEAHAWSSASRLLSNAIKRL